MKEHGPLTPGMTERELREIYQQEILPPLILDNPEEFYAAFDRGPDAAEGFFREKWDWMCGRLAAGPVPCPVAGMDCLALDEREESFAALLTVELSEPAEERRGLALYVSVFFGVERPPRLFLGEHALLPGGGPTVEITERRLDRQGELRRLSHGRLHQGCGNRPFLFAPPDHPLPEDPSLPLEREGWYTAYLDRTARLCAAGG
ncbi:MAG TPA: hypothetical protein H9684_08395 [Firmicutes bacterium]|nr:hypothetical protein [Bacillota bacterium]